MSEERLQEIKDSVEFQYKLAKAKCIDNALLFADEEEELIEEIERLNNIIKEVREYIEELLREEFEVTDTDNINYGMKCQRAYFSDSELIKILEILDKGE